MNGERTTADWGGFSFSWFNAHLAIDWVAGGNFPWLGIQLKFGLERFEKLSVLHIRKMSPTAW
jgi:hypothetical protein